MDKKFKLYNYILDFDNYTRNYVVNNIPSVYRDIRIHLLDEIYNLEKSIIYAINTKGNIRIKHLIDSKVSISLIDMLLLKIRNIKCLKSSKLDTTVDKLTNVKNIVYGWIVNEEKS